MKTPQRKKDIVPVLAERPKEAPSRAMEQLLFERGVVM
jgi:hypothetical protein